MNGRWTSCPSCGGHGLVGVWVGDYDITECAECDGLGRLWVYPSGHVALWQGGPMRGSWPGEYERLAATSPQGSTPDRAGKEAG